MPFREKLGVVRVGPDLLALFAKDGAGAGVLAHRQNSAGGDLGVLEQRMGDVSVVVGRFRVLENRGDLLEVLSPQEKIGVVKGLAREEGQGLRRDFQHGAAFEGRGADALLREEAILGVVGAEGEEFLVDKRRRRHGGKRWGERAPV